MRRFAFAVPVLALTALVGCGSSSKSTSSSSSTPAPAPSSTASTPAATPAPGAASASGSSLGVTETEFKLSPANPSVKAGKVLINIKNAGSTAHAISIDNAAPSGGDAKSATIQPGQSGTLSVTLKAGKTYTWYCPIDGHRGLGMVGKIKVGANGSASVTPSTTSTATGSSSGGSTAPPKTGY